MSLSGFSTDDSTLSEPILSDATVEKVSKFNFNVDGMCTHTIIHVWWEVLSTDCMSLYSTMQHRDRNDLHAAMNIQNVQQNRKKA